MTDRRGPGSPRSGGHRGLFLVRRTIGRLIIVYMLAALGAFVLCGVGLALAQRHAALQEAVRDARDMSALVADRVVEPALPDGSPDDLDTDARFDRVLRERVLGDPVSRVIIADETAVVRYATDEGLVGTSIELSVAEREALLTSTVTARLDDGTSPTRLANGHVGQSLDVSVGVRTPSGQPLLVQTREPYHVVWVTSRAVWLTTVPSLVLALGLLYLVKIAFAYRLTRGLHVVQEEREQLLVTALAAADRERTLIASDLHDGVVQGLAGTSLTLTDVANRSRKAGQPEIADTLTETARNLRQWVRELRSLIVTVTPPSLHTAGLQATLTDLVATLEARAIVVDLDVQVSEAVSETSESMVYRVAQEAIRNVVRHAHAGRVELTVTEEHGWLQLRITDDGRGFNPAVSARKGSVGLTLLAALVHQRGGTLRVQSASGRGTTVTLRLPANDATTADGDVGEDAP